MMSWARSKHPRYEIRRQRSWWGQINWYLTFVRWVIAIANGFAWLGVVYILIWLWWACHQVVSR